MVLPAGCISLCPTSLLHMPNRLSAFSYTHHVLQRGSLGLKFQGGESRRVVLATLKAFSIKEADEYNCFRFSFTVALVPQSL